VQTSTQLVRMEKDSRKRKTKEMDSSYVRKGGARGERKAVSAKREERRTRLGSSEKFVERERNYKRNVKGEEGTILE